MKKLLAGLAIALFTQLCWAAGEHLVVPPVLHGKVLETVDASTYIYVRLQTSIGEIWAAVRAFPAKVGDEITIRDTRVMADFPSKALGRTFDMIVFGVVGDAGPAAQAAAAPVPSMAWAGSGPGAAPPGGEAAPASPHAGMDMDQSPHSGMGQSPHAGMAMGQAPGGDGSNPHANMTMEQMHSLAKANATDDASVKVAKADGPDARIVGEVPQMLQQVFWISVLFVIVATVGYPIFLVVASLAFRRRWIVDDIEPTICLVIAAFNEESGIATKLENALALDYPKDRLQILVASDGSSDRTADIVRSFADRGVQLREFRRMGKTGIQNEVARTAEEEILVFSDANAMYEPAALRRLVRNFADPSVWCVCGQLVYRAANAPAEDCESQYWNYEKFLKRRESFVSSLVGANGSIYAVRRDRYVELDLDLISDLVEPLELVRQGGRVVYEPDAVSVEAPSPSTNAEFHRKVRILTRSIRGLVHERSLLNPYRYGVFSVQLFMHKLLRYLVPFFLAAAVFALTSLAALGSYRELFAAMFVTCSMLSLAAIFGSDRGSIRSFARVGKLLHYYVLVNCALALAWANVLRGRRVTIWIPERHIAS